MKKREVEVEEEKWCMQGETFAKKMLFLLPSTIKTETMTMVT